MKKLSVAIVIIWIILLICLLAKGVPGNVLLWTAFAVTSLLIALMLMKLIIDMHKR